MKTCTLVYNLHTDLLKNVILGYLNQIKLYNVNKIMKFQ